MEPVLSDYGGACLDRVVPALLHRGRAGPPPWLPAVAAEARQIVLLALDGLGWEQLMERAHVAPMLSAMEGRAITTVIPSTTATALTSLTTGAAPARHGVVGYRVRVEGDQVLNVLRWRTPEGDARGRLAASEFQPLPAFEGTHPPVVTRSEFVNTGFTTAHLGGVRLCGWRMASTLVVSVRDLLRAGEPFVYAYYDGIDKVAHEHGLGDAYDAEVGAADRLVEDLAEALPPGAALVVTSDHGQVDVGDRVEPLDPEVMELTRLLSGEGRFRWLHARHGAAEALAEVAGARHGHHGWVRTRRQAEEDGWFGGPMSAEGSSRLGDVAIAVHEPIALFDPADTGELTLRSRHGSLTSAEMWVPLLATGSPAGV
ncbi:MAG: alkaline phosphatase family protein [Acidimicrobiales bacterium]